MLVISLLHLRALLPLASRDETRFNLCGVFIDKTGAAIATDGVTIGVIERAVDIDDLAATLDCPRTNPDSPGVIIRRAIIERAPKVANGLVVDFANDRAVFVWCDLRGGMGKLPDMTDAAPAWIDDATVKHYTPTIQQQAAMSPRLRAAVLADAGKSPAFPHVRQVIDHEKSGAAPAALTSKNRPVAFALEKLAQFSAMARLDLEGTAAARRGEPLVVDITHGVDEFAAAGLRFTYPHAHGMIMPCRKKR